MSDPALGIASGGAFECAARRGNSGFVTGSTVWGASRAYRWECLQQVLPLEERVAWDGVDEFKANTRGWRTRGLRRTFLPASSPGGRAGRREVAVAFLTGGGGPLPRLPRLVSRPALTLARPRSPQAIAMIWGYALSAVRREAQNPTSRGAPTFGTSRACQRAACARSRLRGAARRSRSGFTARRHPARLLVGRTPAPAARAAAPPGSSYSHAG